jgi:hypothetical protein
MVEEDPPWSGVMKRLSVVTDSMARMIESAAAVSPKCDSIIDPAHMAASGLAMPRPAMSGADP